MRRKTCVWQAEDWPRWRYELGALAQPLTAVARAQGVLLGRLADVGLALRAQASLTALTEDVVKTSAIEGETLDGASVRSSLARRLGVDIAALAPADRHVDGVVEMVLDATAWPQVGRHRQVFARHGLARHHPSARSGRPEEGARWRPQHGLRAQPAVSDAALRVRMTASGAEIHRCNARRKLMQHRHLTHSGYSLAAIDDVIARGKRRDWAALRAAVLGDRSLLLKVQRVCAAHVHDPYAQRYHFWNQYVTQHLA